MAWRFDQGHSRIGFIVRHFGLTIVHGHFQKADVQLDYHADEPTQSTMEGSQRRPSIRSSSVSSCATATRWRHFCTTSRTRRLPATATF